MFPRSEDGWHPNIPIRNNESIYVNDEEISGISGEDEANAINKKCVTAMNYFAYRLQIGHPGETLALHLYGRLFQQWIVNMYTVVEQMRLNYLKFNQKQIRAELYNGLQDAICSGDSTTNVGQQIILPSSFTGGPRQMHKLYQDGMAIV